MTPARLALAAVSREGVVALNVAMKEILTGSTCMLDDLPLPAEERQLIAEALETGMEFGCEWSDAARVRWSVALTPMAAAGGPRILSFRELSAAEIDAQRGARLREVARHAGGVIHDLNNAYAGVAGLLEHLAASVRDAELQSVAQNLLRSASKWRDQLGTLHLLADGLRSTRDRVPLAAIREHALRLCATDAQDAGVRVEWDPVDGSPSVWCSLVEAVELCAAVLRRLRSESAPRLVQVEGVERDVPLAEVAHRGMSGFTVAGPASASLDAVAPGSRIEQLLAAHRRGGGHYEELALSDGGGLQMSLLFPRARRRS